MLNSEVSCRVFIETQDAATIADQLRYDQDLCSRGRLPSILAYYLPRPNSKQADEISLHLGRGGSSDIPRLVRRLQYAGIIQSIKAHLDHMGRDLKTSKVEGEGESSQSAAMENQMKVDEIKTTIKVLRHFQESQDLTEFTPETPLEDVISALVNLHKTKAKIRPGEGSNFQLFIKAKEGQRVCYMCHYLLTTRHPLYSSLCNACGQFNLAESSISLPPTLCLNGRTALVTGGRLNLGYHTALRLLRCGAKVIVTSRYPHDAERRYLAERDCEDWFSRLRTIGADFRAAKDVFRMVSTVKEQLLVWSREESDVGKEIGKLDVLINNAAQTLTDSVEAESKAIQFEEKLQPQGSKSLLSSGYQARVRGNSNIAWLPDGSSVQNGVLEDNPEEEHKTMKTADYSPYKTPPKSSWMQSLDEIPYEDVISAYSVNAFVPLILIRELLPLMGSLSDRSQSSNPLHSISTSSIAAKPQAYILNVSSREGIFEPSPTSSAKRGHHVHTNMSKASLNMLTETEAAEAWRLRRVAMNSVDPGYMSAAPEIAQLSKERGKGGIWGKEDKREKLPIGWEDGAGRVLWPVARGEVDGVAVWGRFLKHFRAVEVGM